MDDGWEREGGMTDDDANEMPTHEIDFHYEKSRFHRVIHFDGAYGTITAYRTLVISAFSERQPIPKMTTVTFTEDGSELRTRRSESSKSGVLREIEATLILNHQAACGLRDWLSMKIAELEAISTSDEGGNEAENEVS